MNKILILNDKVFVNGLCCPQADGFGFIAKTCCECVYVFDVVGSIEAGCGNSTYFPNRCDPLNFKTQDIVIGPFKFDAEIVVGDGNLLQPDDVAQPPGDFIPQSGILVDDELLVNGVVFQPGLYPVEPTPECTDGLCPGSTGVEVDANCVQFAGGPSSCNGQHVIPPGTVIAALNKGETLTLAAGDNHGIDIFMRGEIVVKPISIP